jgi:hypothetical protein
VIPTTGTHEVAGLLGSLGALGVLVAAASLLLAWEDLAAFAVLLLAGEYVGGLYARRARLDRWSLLEAIALLALAELCAWSIQLRVKVAHERAVVVARIGSLAALLVGSVAAAALVLATAGLPRARGIEWAAIGTAAAVAVLAVIARLSRRDTEQRPQ